VASIGWRGIFINQTTNTRQFSFRQEVVVVVAATVMTIDVGAMIMQKQRENREAESVSSFRENVLPAAA
jgi:hypothetical protein